MLPLVSRVRILQGHLLGKLLTLGFDLNVEAKLDAVTLEVVKTSEIEGEKLNDELVRSSVAWYLGIETYDMPTATREIDAIIEMMLVATYDYQTPLTLNDLLGWHYALFPTGYSGLYTIKKGAIRDDSKGPMQVVSGGYGREQVHFVAPSADRLPIELERFAFYYDSIRQLMSRIIFTDDELSFSNTLILWHPFCFKAPEEPFS